jgi:hypothetical protein
LIRHFCLRSWRVRFLSPHYADKRLQFGQTESIYDQNVVNSEATFVRARAGPRFVPLEEQQQLLGVGTLPSPEPGDQDYIEDPKAALGRRRSSLAARNVMSRKTVAAARPSTHKGWFALG